MNPPLRLSSVHFEPSTKVSRYVNKSNHHRSVESSFSHASFLVYSRQNWVPNPGTRTKRRKQFGGNTKRRRRRLPHQVDPPSGGPHLHPHVAILLLDPPSFSILTGFCDSHVKTMSFANLSLSTDASGEQTSCAHSGILPLHSCKFPRSGAVMICATCLDRVLKFLVEYTCRGFLLNRVGMRCLMCSYAFRKGKSRTCRARRDALRN